MPRGRLIYPFLIEIAQLDLSATNADPDGAGPLTSGYDPDFREVRVLPTSDKLGAGARVEASLIKVPGQFGNPQTFAALMEVQTGNLAQVEFQILFHFRTLENMGLIEASTGTATIKVGDRLNAIYQVCDGSLIQLIRNPPGAYCTKASPLFGLHNRRNLLETVWKSRDPGA